MRNALSIFFAASTLLCGSLNLPAQTAEGAKIIPKDAILDGLKRPEKTRGWSTSRSIGVAEKPQVTTQAILFKFGTPEIDGEQSFAQIKELGKALEDPTMKSTVLEIQGHTDNKGSEEYNQKLSEARAQKIVQELQQHYNLTVKQLIPTGKGKSEPVAGSVDQQTDEQRAQNRRVVIVVINRTD